MSNSNNDKLYYASKKGAELGNKIVVIVTLIAGVAILANLVISVITEAFR